LVNIAQASQAIEPHAGGGQPNVLVLGLNYSPEPTGIAPYTSALARGLQERGFGVRVLASHPHYPEWEIRPGYGKWTRSETIDNVAVTRLLHYVPSRPEGIRRLLSEISFGLRIVFARWGKPDVIVMVSPALFSSALAMLRVRFVRKKPVVNVWLQDIYGLGMKETGAGGGLVARVVIWIERATLKAASGVVVIHSRFGHYLVNSLGIDPQKIEVVRNWTHLESAPPTDMVSTRATHGWGIDETIVLHAGNMGVKQGLSNVVHAARLADEQGLPIRFVLLGNGSQRQALRELGSGIDRLQFLESLDGNGFQAALAAADILLVNEKIGVAEMAVPSKLTSYFNAGRPVLAATDRAGATAGEIAASGAGCVVDAGNPQYLVDAVLQLAGNPRMAAELGANGMRYRRDVLGEDVAIDRYAQWLGSLAARQGRKRGRTLPAAQKGNS